MRILVCTKRDIHGAYFLNRLLPALAGHEVLSVWLSDKDRDAEAAISELAELRFVERTLPANLLFPLIDMLPEAITARAPEATFAGIGRRYRVPVEIVTGVNDDRTRARLAALAPDILIVARFSYLFDAETLALPCFGMLNVHPGRLPEYAGLHAPLRAVIDGAAAFGCSVHWIAAGIDDGPLLAVHDQPIDPTRSLLAQVGALYPLAIPTLLAVLADCATGRRPPGQAQDLSRRRYYSMPTATEFEALRRHGLRLSCPMDYTRCLGRYLPPGMALPDLPEPPR